MRIGNWPLIWQALDHIIIHADQYDQGNWRSSCGSLRCFAGWIAHYAGYRDVLVPNSSWPEHPPIFLGVAKDGADEDPIEIQEAALLSMKLDPQIHVWDPDHMDWDIDTIEFAESLFGGSLTLDLILERVRDYAREDGVDPSPVALAEMIRRGIVTAWNDEEED